MIRIYTEHKSNLPELVSRFVPAFTIIAATGFWHKKPEKSTIIEISDIDINMAKQIAAEIKTINNQQAVLIEVINEDSILV